MSRKALENKAESEGRTSRDTADDDFNPPPIEVIQEFRRLVAAKARLEAERDEIEAARADIQAYVRFMRRTGLPVFKYDLSLHHLLQVRQYERLTLRQIGNILQMLPPGSGKTNTLTIYLTWRLALRPDMRVLSVSHTDTFAEDLGDMRRTIMLTREWMQVSGGARLDPKRQGRDTIVIQVPTGKRDDDGNELYVPTGVLYSRGLSSGIVGIRCDLLVVDDPHRSREEITPDRLAKLRKSFQQEVMSRLLPGGQIICVSTRWAKGDIAGFLCTLAAEGNLDLDVLRLPMLSEGEGDALARPAGEPLWSELPGYYAQHKHQQRDIEIWTSMYQQRPPDSSGSWVSLEEINAACVDEPPRRQDSDYIFAVDLAYTTNGGDYTVIAVFAVDRHRGLTMVDGFRARVQTDVTMARLDALAEVYNPRYIMIDDDTGSKQFKSLMQERAQRTRAIAVNRLYLVAIAGRDKAARAANVPAMIRSGQLRFLRTLPFMSDLLHEVLEFPDVAHDDILDCLSLATHKPTALPVPTGNTDTAKPPQNYYAPKGTLERATFIAEDGRYICNVSLGNPSDTPSRPNRIP
jgi:predicted phage terminase large subunit-like protein